MTSTSFASPCWQTFWPPPFGGVLIPLGLYWLRIAPAVASGAFVGAAVSLCGGSGQHLTSLQRTPLAGTPAAIVNAVSQRVQASCRRLHKR